MEKRIQLTVDEALQADADLLYEIVVAKKPCYREDGPCEENAQPDEYDLTHYCPSCSQRYMDAAFAASRG